jgi:hypothetical protein
LARFCFVFFVFVFWFDLFPFIHFWIVRDSERLFAINSIPEVGFSAAHKPMFIFLRWLQKNLMRLSRFPIFRTTCLLNVLCGEFYINANVILTSKIKHFEERQVVYPSYSAFHTARMNIFIIKEWLRHQASFHSNWNIARPKSYRSKTI